MKTALAYELLKQTDTCNSYRLKTMYLIPRMEESAWVWKDGETLSYVFCKEVEIEDIAKADAERRPLNYIGERDDGEFLTLGDCGRLPEAYRIPYFLLQDWLRGTVQ